MTVVHHDEHVIGQKDVPLFQAFVCDDETREIVADACIAMRIDTKNVIVSMPNVTFDWLSKSPTPNILLVDFSVSESIFDDVERLSEVCDPDTRVILMGDINDLKLYRDLMAAGVTDYLVKPLNKDELVAAVQQATNLDEAAKVSKASIDSAVECRVAAIVGVRGGVGASTIAANAAWFAAEKLDLSVTLIDMDLTFGTLAVAFDVDPGAGLSDAMLEPERMDELFITRALVTLSERLKLMAAEADPSRGDITSAQAFKGVLEHVRSDADLIVVDLPRSVAVNHLKLLELFDQIVLIGEPNLASMRDCSRLRTVIEAVNPDAAVSVVINRQGIAAKEELSGALFEEGSGLKIEGTLPFDARTALRADAKGACVVETAAGTKLGKSMARVSRLIAGIQEQKNKSRLTSLFGISTNKATA